MNNKGVLFMTVNKKRITTVEYMCRFCGKKEVRSVNAGRPMPGNCSRKQSVSGGKSLPHSWVINRKF